MSTKSTIFSPKAHDKWWLEEEMLDESTRWVATNPMVELRTNHLGAFFEITLPDDLLDAIGALHAKRELPHQRARAEANASGQPHPTEHDKFL